jgi:acyl-CoA thioesterase FadM
LPRGFGLRPDKGFDRMNLWLRLLHLIITSFARPRLDPMTDASCLGFRVWPHDLDVSMHVNNSRYWALMDLGRIDLIIRSGLWRAVVRHRWAPIVNAATIRFRRELTLFRRFRVETRIVAWTQTFVVMEHRVLTAGRAGRDIVAAVALASTGLYDRKAKCFVPVERLFAEIGLVALPSPEPSPDVAAFLATGDALRQAA